MKTFSSAQDWQNERKTIHVSLGFVPTMGALHPGHLSLVDKSVAENEVTVVSIFVNPTQFNNKSDLNSYPSNLKQDIALLKSAGADYVITPDFEQLYPDNYKYKVSESELSKKLCGAHRPGHFDGVLTVVMKLFNLVDADRAYFGEKDFQQLQLIKSMTEAFFMKTQVIPCETIRETSGLAMSSRNQRLDPKQLKQAPKFHKTLQQAVSAREVSTLLSDSGFEVDYVEDIQGRRFGAVTLGDVRLIDNVPLP